MPQPDVKLHLLCGKIASGKSTLAAKLREEQNAVILSEDDWLSALHGEEMSTITDFVYRSGKLRDAMEPHILSLLGAGVTVVLDFQANTLDSRAWLKTLADRPGVTHLLHFLDAPDEMCRARLRARNESGDHAFSVTEEQFDLITAHYVPPTRDEGFHVIRHTPDTLE